MTGKSSFLLLLFVIIEIPSSIKLFVSEPFKWKKIISKIEKNNNGNENFFKIMKYCKWKIYFIVSKNIIETRSCPINFEWILSLSTFEINLLIMILIYGKVQDVKISFLELIQCRPLAFFGWEFKNQAIGNFDIHIEITYLLS